MDACPDDDACQTTTPEHNGSEGEGEEGGFLTEEVSRRHAVYGDLIWPL